MTATLLLSLALYLVTDSAGSVISEANLHVNNHVVCTTSYDGLLRYNFAQGVESVEGTLTAAGYDTLSLTLYQDADGRLQRIYMNKTPFNGSLNNGDEVYYTLGASKSLSRSLKTTALPTADASYEIFTAEVAEDADYAYAVAESGLARDVKISGYAGAPHVANLPSAGKLTAGEVNDFAKWQLWSGIINGSHKEYVKTWQMQATERYRVAVMNKEQYPLADVRVELLDKKGQVLFAARTDNTGHAELWANAFTANRQSTDMTRPAAIRIISNEKEAVTDNNIKPYPAVNVFTVTEDCGAPANVDVFFVADATGSMGDELSYLKAEMLDVIGRSRAAVGEADIRIGALVYRDHGDLYLSRISPLTDDINTTKAFLEKQEAGGGGDYPEAVPEALMATINSADWSKKARARIAFLILDAPCHSDSVTLERLHAQIHAAAEKGIRVVPIVCSGLQKDGELLMREIALFTNGTSFFLTDDSGIGHTHLKPTTDSLKVEHLNDMLVRTIIEFSTMPECDRQWADEALADNETDAFVPNPFNIDDLDTIPAILPAVPVEDVLIVRPNPCKDICFADLPLGADALFLCDISGKTIQVLGAVTPNTVGLMLDTSYLPTGVYFIKAFYGGRWYTKKLIVA